MTKIETEPACETSEPSKVLGTDTGNQDVSLCEDGVCEAPCWTAPANECEKRECGEISGSPFSIEKKCFSESEIVGCYPQDAGAGNTIIVEIDPAGDCWRFSNTMVPSGWISKFDQDWPYSTEFIHRVAKRRRKREVGSIAAQRTSHEGGRFRAFSKVLWQRAYKSGVEISKRSES